MIRLTHYDNDGRIYSSRGYEIALSRLASYESTGLDPEEITVNPQGCVFYCNRKCNLDGDWCAEGPGCPREMSEEEAMRAVELLYIEKNGRLAVLPCRDDAVLVRDGIEFKADHWNITLTAFAENQPTPSGTKVALFSIKEAEAALGGSRNNAAT